MSPPFPEVPAVHCFHGVTFHLLQKDTLINFLIDRAQSGCRTFVPNHNLHSIHLFHQHAGFRAAYAKGDLIHVDGMPLILWGKLLGYPCRRSHRLTYLDWGPELLRRMNELGMRIAVIGGTPESCVKTEAYLKDSYPRLSCWTHHGFFDPRDSKLHGELFNTLKTFRPQVLMVGMGMPRQEQWILEHMEALPPCVLLPCGAFFDYLNGTVPTPRRKAGQWSLEWLSRFAAEPRRLFFRYFVEPWFLVPAMTRDLFRLMDHRRRARDMRGSQDGNL